MIIEIGKYEFWWLMTTELLPCPILHATYDTNGYVRISGNWRGFRISAPEHRVVIEESLARKLRPEEEVHHINGVKDDNRLENLLVCTRREHQEIDGRLERLRARTRTPESRQRMAEAIRSAWACGKYDEQRDHRRSPEWRAKMSAAQRARYAREREARP